MIFDIAPFELALAQPLLTAHGELSQRRGCSVTVRASGVAGRGEASPLEAWGRDSLEATLGLLQGFRLARAPESLDEISAAVASLASSPAARCGVECALLEHLALRRGVAVARLLCDAPRWSLPTSALIDGATADQLALAAIAAVSRGHRTVKVKVATRPLAVEARRLHAVRLAIGPAVALRVDANGGWTEGAARSALRGLESLDLELCEQPVAAADVEGLRRLTRQVPVPIAADEALAEPGAIDRVLEADPAPAAAVLVLKPMVLGGLLPALALARRAAAAGIRCFVTTSLDGAWGRAAAAHLAAALPGDGALAHGLATGSLLVGEAADPWAPRGGQVTVADRPGWGSG